MKQTSSRRQHGAVDSGADAGSRPSAASIRIPEFDFDSLYAETSQESDSSLESDEGVEDVAGAGDSVNGHGYDSPEDILGAMGSAGLDDLVFVADDYVDDGDVENEARQSDEYQPSITDGDFEDPAQRIIFRRLKDRIRLACNVNVRADQRASALEWIFVPGTLDAKKVDFDTSCAALCARSVVVRARVMHKLWESGVVVPKALPFLAVPAPRSIMDEIEVILGANVHASIAGQVWNWPSVHVEILRSMFSDVPIAEYSAAMNDLQAHGYVGINAARAYFISRNPALLSHGKRSRWQFATSIAGDY
jgi:hypothetical protein